IKLDCENIPEELFYPTNEEEVEDILENGIIPGDRSMVHLSRTFQDAMRAGLVHTEDPIILGIDTDICMDAGSDIGKAARTVYLCRNVPAEALFVADPDEYGSEEEED
ncbi:MAG: RNA 2'-phosphotransferase, partial [Candidatus Methanomethylophilaceae archaeon]|nr:RNA 2'-phosphotransferase [Candidatus Methanomethylophilaceae archaeon]